MFDLHLKKSTHDCQYAKIIILTIMSIFLFSNSSKASEGFDIGADISIGFSDIYNNNLSWTETYSLGCDIGVKCTKNLNIVSGIFFEKNGYYDRNISFYESIPISGRFSLYYVSIPLLLQFYPLKNLPLYGSIGVTNSFNVGSHVHISPIPDDFQYDIKKLRKYNCSANIGIGYRLSRLVTIEIRYSKSLGSIYTDYPNYNISTVSLSFRYHVKSF